jgi:hypothetical protein
MTRPKLLATLFVLALANILGFRAKESLSQNINSDHVFIFLLEAKWQ